MRTVLMGRFSDAVAMLVAVVVTLSLCLPVLVKRRAASREVLCKNNLKQIGIALHNYHSAYKTLPAGMGGTTGEKSKLKNNGGQLGPLVGILPFVEAQSTWELIANPYQDADTGQEFPPMGPVPWYPPEKYRPWAMAPDTYRCPTLESEEAAKVEETVQGWTSKSTSVQGVIASYVASFGDGTHLVGQVLDPAKASPAQMRSRMATDRGAFGSLRPIKFRDILDGLSNTLMYSEVVANRHRLPGRSEVLHDVKGISQSPARCLNAIGSEEKAFWGFGRGGAWAHGAPVMTGFQTVLPPNSPSCTSDLGVEDVIASSSSLHPGGVHVLVCDGAVLFISDTIDCGDSSAPGVSIGDGYTAPGSKSPYGLWGALGSRAARETVRGQLEREFSSQPAQRAGVSAPKKRFRSWTDKTGKKRLRAEFIEIVDQETVRLRSASGEIHEIPLNDFSDRDVFQLVDEDLERLGE